jgi:hypothetical protein
VDRNQSFVWKAFRAFCSTTLFVLVALPAQAVDKDVVIRQARAVYYSLNGEGMQQFQCNMTPNWEALLGDLRKTDSAAVDRAVQKLKGLQFSVTVPSQGAAKVTHNEISADNKQMADGLTQIYNGMDQMIVGFFQSWSVFVISPGLPEAGSTFQLEEIPSGYRISYKDGSADVVTLMNKDYSITSIAVSSKEFDSTLQPLFKQTAKGLLLSGYQAIYIGASAADKTELQVKVEYQQIDGLQLPKTLDLQGSYGGNPFKGEVAFTGCHADHR